MSFPQQQQQRINHPPVSHRLTELLEAIKQEFMTMSSEASAYLMHKDEFDHKVLSQHVNELQQVRKTIYDLDVAHRKMKEQYEEEIRRLKLQLEARGGPAPPLPNSHGSGLPPPQKHNGGAQGEQFGPQQPLPNEYMRYYGPGVQTPYGAPDGANVAPSVAPGGPPPPAAGPAGSPSQAPQQPNSFPHNVGASQAAPPLAPTSGQSAPMVVPPPANPAPNSSGSAAPPPQGDPVLAQGTSSAAAGLVQPLDDDAMAQAEMLGNNLAFQNLDQIPVDQIQQHDGWLVVHNQRAPKQIDIENVHNLEHPSVVCCVRFSQDGKYLATGCNRSAQIYDVQSGQLVCKLEHDSADSDEDLYIRSVCFSPDATMLATGAEDHKIRVWDIATRKIRYLFTGHEQDIYSLDISKSGRHIASGSGDGTVRIWDLENGQCVLTLSIEGGVTAVSISPDGRFVAAGSLDHVVRVWDMQTGYLVERLEMPDGHNNSVYSVAFTPNGEDLISGSLDKTIKLWELQAPRGNQSTHKGGVCTRTIVGHKDFVLSVATTPDGKWILSASKDRGVQFWDPRNGQAQLMLQAHGNSVISVAPSPVDGLFATGSGDYWAKIWRYVPVPQPAT